MRARAFALSFGLIALGGGEAIAQTQRIDTFTTPSGIEVWHVPSPGLPIVAIQAAIPDAGVQDNPAQQGLAGAVAALMTKGAGDLDAEGFRLALEDLNAGLSVSANNDWASAALTVVSWNLEPAADLMRTVLLEPRFDADEVALWRSRTEIALDQAETNPGVLAGRAMAALMTPDHPYARYATRETLARLDEAALREGHARYFTRDALIVTAVGEVDQDRLAQAVDHMFADLPQLAPAATDPSVATPKPPALVVKPLPQPQSLIRFAAPGIDDEDPDWYAARVAAYIVGGGGLTSRLITRLRKDAGLVYSGGLGLRTARYSDTIEGNTSTDNATAAQTMSEIKAVLGKFAAQGPTAEEVDDAKAYLTGVYPLAFDSNIKIANRLSQLRASDLPIDYWSKHTGYIEAVTQADVARVAKRLFHPSRFSFVVVGEPKGLGDNASDAVDPTPDSPAP
ncbi:MAG: M16 family metallopeptidase [Maricaulaceae bacterium]